MGTQAIDVSKFWHIKWIAQCPSAVSSCIEILVSFVKLVVKFINYSWGCKPIPAQYSDHMYTTVNPNTNQTIELTFDTNSSSAN